MLAQDRYRKISEILEKENSVRVSALTQLLNVSVETVRRDLEFMETEGLLKRVHGGAVLEMINGTQNTFSTREGEYREQKNQIGEIACRFIKEGQSIAMDVSTTNFEVVKVLKKRFQRLTVLTNSISIAQELADMDRYTVIVPGGILGKEELSLVGDMAEENLAAFHVDTAFISMSGISLREGLTDYGFQEVRIKKKMMRIARETLVLADSSKFDVVSLIKVCDLSDVNMIITDDKIKEGILAKYRSSGIEILNS